MADPARGFPFFNPPMRRFPTHFTFAFQNMVCYHFYFLQAPGMATFYPLTIFSFVLPILLNFLVLKYQNQDKSPFQTRPKTVLLGILSLILYCFCYDYLQRIRMHGRPAVLAHVFHHCVLFFGYLAMATLASLLLPDSASPAFYAFYITLSVSDLLYLVYQRIRRSQLRGTRFGDTRNSPFFVSMWRILAQRNPNQGHLLPL